VSDDISIPQAGPMSPRTSFTHSYRARRSGTDRGTRSVLLVSVSFHLTPAALESLEALASEIGGRLMDAALAVAPQRPMEGSCVD